MAEDRGRLPSVKVRLCASLALAAALMSACSDDPEPFYPPDLDCADVGPVTVTGSDPHGLDGDGDGVACGGD